jgi:hypothetical protein
LQVDAVALHCVELTIDSRERELLFADPDAGQHPGLDFIRACDDLKFLRHGGRS